MTAFEFDYLGPYHVERLIGRGGMGSVYKALHARTGQPVAIKVIATGIANQPKFRRRFAVEIEALKRLQHPNIVNLIGYGEEKGILFYSMEYVAGHSIHELLRARKQLNWQEAIQIGIETTSALKHAHNLGIIHRDLKPANLMMDTSGTVKLTDFGIAKLFGSTDETAVGAVIGTADYMPPEQAEGKAVTIRSDLYSLGCLLYAILSGKPPFSGKSVPEVLYSVRYSPVPQLQDLASDTPAELIDLVMHLLEKEPTKRPPTALVVSNRLKAIQQATQGKVSLSGEIPNVSIEPDQPQKPAVGKTLTSLDMDDDEVQLTDKEISELPLPDTRNEFQLGTHEKQTLLAAHQPNSSGDSLRADHSKELEMSSEHFSAGSASNAQPVGSANDSIVTSGGPSHYTAVSESGDSHFSPSISPAPVADRRWDWLQLLSVAGILGLLFSSIGFIWWKLQPETAERLYDRINQAAESGDDSLLLGVSAEIDEFLLRFPEDERAVDVRALADEAELIRRLRLLNRKAAREGGVNELSIVEQAFLDSLKIRAQDYELGQRKLEAFIDVFSRESLDSKDLRLVELANFAKNRAINLNLDRKNRAKGQLDESILAAERNLSKEKLLKFYADILILYDDKPWAQEQIKRIKQLIDEEDSR